MLWWWLDGGAWRGRMNMCHTWRHIFSVLFFITIIISIPLLFHVVRSTAVFFSLYWDILLTSGSCHGGWMTVTLKKIQFKRWQHFIFIFQPRHYLIKNVNLCTLCNFAARTPMWQSNTLICVSLQCSQIIWPFDYIFRWKYNFQDTQYAERFRRYPGKYEFYRAYVDRNKKKTLLDFARINLFVVDSKVMKTEEIALYTVTQLLSDIGGQLGMWIGVSVITLSEVAELFIVIFSACFCRRRRNIQSDDGKTGHVIANVDDVCAEKADIWRRIDKIYKNPGGLETTQSSNYNWLANNLYKYL